MKFQVIKSPWCNSTESKWTIIELGDTTFVKMGTIEKRGDDIIAYTEVHKDMYYPGYSPGVEDMTARALYEGMWDIHQHEKQGKWRKDFGQI